MIRYKTISLKTPDINKTREQAFDHDADIDFRLRHLHTCAGK